MIGREINQDLFEFSKWNVGRKLIGKNHVFSGDLTHSNELIAEKGLNLEEMGVESVIPKQATYNAAFSLQHADNLKFIRSLDNKDDFVARPSHRLELVIDDSAPYKKGIKDCDLVLTWWNPQDDAVREFLRNKDYLNFQM